MTIPDLLPILGGVALAPALLLAPGYFWSRLLELGPVSLAERAAWSLLLSLATAPVLAYNFFLLVPYRSATAWVFAALQTAVPMILLHLAPSRLPERPAGAVRLRRLWMFPALLAVLAPLCVIDVEWGERLYRGYAAHDYVKHTVVTDAISRTGVHPVNPAFYPGHPIPLFFYLLWFLLCSLLDGLSFCKLGPHVAVQSMTAWAALALFAAVFLLAARFLRPLTRRTIVICFVLLFAGGLDLIPAALQACVEFRPGRVVLREPIMLQPHLEIWNAVGRVPSWLAHVVWAPHHVAGGVVGVTGLLLALGLRRSTDRSNTWIRALLFASSAAAGLGLSVWVTLVFCTFWLLWVLVALVRRWSDDLVFLGRAIIPALLLAAPFLYMLSRARLSDAPPLVFDVRDNDFWRSYAGSYNLGSWREVIDLVWLPLMYLLELGVFLLGGLFWWRYHRRPAEKYEIALAVLAAVSLGLVSFVRSAIHNNDFGWRGILPAQLVLLLATAWTLERLWRLRTWRLLSVACLASLALGLAATALDWVAMRVYPAAQDLVVQRGIQGRRSWALKQCYEQVRHGTPREAVVQHHPEVAIEYDHGFNAHRQTVVLDLHNGIVFDTQGPLFETVRTEVASIFEPAATAMSIAAAARKYGINILVLKDSDPGWDSPAWEDRIRFRVLAECTGALAYEVGAR